MNYSDLPTADLGRARKSGKGTSGTRYYLHRLPHSDRGWALYIRYTEDGVNRSCLVTDDLPETAVEDFDYYVDREDEETRILRALAAEEFGL